MNDLIAGQLVVMLNALRLEIRSAAFSHATVEGVKSGITEAQIAELTEHQRGLRIQADDLARIAQGGESRD